MKFLNYSSPHKQCNLIKIFLAATFRMLVNCKNKSVLTLFGIYFAFKATIQFVINKKFLYIEKFLKISILFYCHIKDFRITHTIKLFEIFIQKFILNLKLFAFTVCSIF